MTTPYPDPALEAHMADLDSELVERRESLRMAPAGKDGSVERILQLSSGAGDRRFTFEMSW